MGTIIIILLVISIILLTKNNIDNKNNYRKTPTISKDTYQDTNFSTTVNKTDNNTFSNAENESDSDLYQEFKTPTIDNETYHAKNYILSNAEMLFYDALIEATKNTYLQIWPKMGLKEIVYVKDSQGNKNPYKYFNKIDRKHIDFTLVNPKSGKPLLCIELDDKSHQKQNRIERDEFLNKVMQQADITLMHIAASRDYNVQELETTIKSVLP